MTNHEIDIPRPSHWPCPACGVQTHPHKPDCPVLAQFAELDKKKDSYWRDVSWRQAQQLGQQKQRLNQAVGELEEFKERFSWQTEPPTEPVERCLLRWGRPGGWEEAVYDIRIHKSQLWCFWQGRPCFRLAGTQPGTLYCPLPDIAEAN